MINFERNVLAQYGHNKGFHVFIENISNDSVYEWKNLCYIKYTKFKESKISCILSKTFVLSTSYAKCGNSNHKIFKEEESVEMIKFPVLINLWYKWVDYFVFNIESIQKIKTQVFQTLLMANSCDLLIGLCEKARNYQRTRSKRVAKDA